MEWFQIFTWEMVVLTKHLEKPGCFLSAPGTRQHFQHAKNLTTNNPYYKGNITATNRNTHTHTLLPL